MTCVTGTYLLLTKKWVPEAPSQGHEADLSPPSSVDAVYVLM
jgi:hypothetical protein